ncbi:hypothetical protein [Asticcacaulis sp.]|uniref:hypothetical protein n=1 Tax=Asticcacaulis sp. TaxID=1872648 RepID=UPI003F7C9CDF
MAAGYGKCAISSTRGNKRYRLALIRTTGIVIRLNEAWFAGGNPQASSRRESVAQAFMQLLCRERSVAPSDVDCAFTNIAIMTDGAPKKISDAIVIYDTVYGGLRLTEDLYHHFSEYAAQLDRAAGLAGRAALVPDDVTERIKLWAEELETADVLANPVMIAPGGMYMVYKPGSTVGMYFQGVLVSREIVAPRLIDLMNDGQKQLAYIYDHNGRKSFVSHEEIQPIDDDSQFIYWNPDENTFHELDEGRDQTATEQIDKDTVRRVFRPGSIVMIPHHGTMVKRTLLGPRQVFDRMGMTTIQYEYSDDNGVGLVMHDQIQTTGAEWGLIGWDPVSNQFKELPS